MAVDGSKSLEILRCTQDDIESEEIATACSKPRNDGGECVASEEMLRYTQDDIEPTMARRCCALLSMTLLVS